MLRLSACYEKAHFNECCNGWVISSSAAPSQIVLKFIVVQLAIVIFRPSFYLHNKSQTVIKPWQEILYWYVVEPCVSDIC
jgi:hypothetical protein